MPIGKAPTSRHDSTESASVWECENMQQEVIKDECKHVHETFGWIYTARRSKRVSALEAKIKALVFIQTISGVVAFFPPCNPTHRVNLASSWDWNRDGAHAGHQETGPKFTPHKLKRLNDQFFCFRLDMWFHKASNDKHSSCRLFKPHQKQNATCF